MRLPSFHEWLFKFEWESVVSEENRGAQPILGEAAVSDGERENLMRQPLPVPLSISGGRRRIRRGDEGAIEILCDEIGYPFMKGMESSRLLVEFVRRLVLEIAEMRWTAEAIADKLVTRQRPSVGSGELLDKVLDLLNGDIAEMVGRCQELHELSRDLNPEDAYPTDHLIDMLSSCISAIRFGLEHGRLGIGSRHAAEAADHVWRLKYGIRLFDGYTPTWERDWARHKLHQALVMLAFPPTKGADETTPHDAAATNLPSQREKVDPTE